MVWEQGAVVVVMTTRVIERGRHKCWQYWPSDAGSSQLHGQFSVTTVAVEAHTDYVVSVLRLVNNKVRRKKCQSYNLGCPDYALHHLEIVCDFSVARKELANITYLMWTLWEHSVT